MDPQIKSILTSIGIIASSSIAAWAAKNGLIPAADQSTVANDLVAFGFGALAAALAWYKSRAHTPAAQIDAVNAADNGVKVVADSKANALVPTAIAPLK